jgi:hypothetical protein
MKLTGENVLLAQAEQALRTCLADVPFCVIGDAEMRPVVAGVELEMGVTIGKTRRRLLIEVKNSGQPRFARDAGAARLSRRNSSAATYPIFAAPFITPETGRQLAARGIGYVDFAGNCRLCFDTVYVRREGLSNRFTEKRDLRTLYSPRAERVLRVLLDAPGRRWKVQELASAAEVSLGLVSNVKRLLEDRDWVDAGAEGLMLARPRELIDEWRGAHRIERSRRHDYFTLDPIAAIEKRTAAVCKEASSRYALAAFSAAARYAPAVRYQRVFAYVQNADAVAKPLSVKPVESGANLTLLEPYDDGVYQGTREMDGILLTSPTQTFLDLAGIKGRGEEAADVILRDVLEPTW